jgi:hypothetical protein
MVDPVSIIKAISMPSPYQLDSFKNRLMPKNIQNCQFHGLALLGRQPESLVPITGIKSMK